MIETVREVGPGLGIAPTCALLGLPTATYYRRITPKPPPEPRPSPPRTLAAAERGAVLEVLHEPAFVDLAPAQVYAQLLDEKRYLCSERTMYRILEANQEVRERRDQLRHPGYAPPQLLPTGPNQLWSWDITKLLGTVTYCAVSAVGNDSLSLAPPVRRDARGQATEFIC
jgi:putative transposase